MMEKTLRVLGGGEDHTHSHEGSEHHNKKASDDGTSSAIEPHSSNSGLKSRRQAKTGHSDEQEPQTEEVNGNFGGPSKLSAYLNLFGDFVHNMWVVPGFLFPEVLLTCLDCSTDGLA
jgi:zinc transporter 7